MIVNYSSNYYNYFKEHISEFDVQYLNNDTPFSKNLVFLLDNVPVGLISYSIIYDRIELDYIWTCSDYRNSGIASKLLLFMFNESGINNITLEVSVDNVPAINLYKKFGFKVATVRKNYYGGIDAYLMIKE